MAYVLGVDGGIASVGWALLDDVAKRIVAAGVWCFDAPENPKDRTPLNAIRRQHRGQRRVIRRRRQRLAEDAAEKHVRRAIANLPGAGSVRALQVTDRQFGRMRLLLGEALKSEKIAASQMVLL